MKRGYYFFVLVFLISFVAGGSVGLSPVHFTEFFEPYLERTYTFNTFNSNPEDGIKPYISGDLAKYARISEEYIQGSGSFEVILKLPAEIDIPGNHTIIVGVIESKNTTTKQVIGGISAIEGRIDIIVPYPGVYLESSFQVSDINEGEEAHYEASINNLGTDDLRIKPTISVYNGANSEKVETIEPESIYLATKNRTTISGKINSKDYAAGNYFALLTLEYADKVDKVREDFKIGEFLVEITDYSYQFEKGKINPFIIEVKSLWNSPIERAYAEVYFTDEGNVVGYFKTSFTELNPWEEKNLTGYFDATEIEAKRYTASITVYYDDESVNKLVAVYIVSPEKETYLYIAIIFVLVIALIAIIFLIVKNRKLRNEK